MRSGKGKLTYANGNVYEGDFIDGNEHTGIVTSFNPQDQYSQERHFEAGLLLTCISPGISDNEDS